MTKRLLVTGLAVLVLLALGGAALAGGGDAGQAKAVKLADASLIVEVNATDGDAGLQVFLDGEPWRKMTMTAPNGTTILGIDAVGKLRDYGLTELFSESSEPPFDEFPLAEFKTLFPAGTYTFAGETIEGKKMTGGARLSHAIPAGPRILSPREEQALSRGAAVVRWRSNPQPGIRIVGYRVIVTTEKGALREFNADLPASARSLRVPAEFLRRGAEYKVEIQEIERSGNQTLTEVPFRVR